MKAAAGVILVLLLAACGPAVKPTGDQSQIDAPTKQIQQLELDHEAACKASGSTLPPGGHWKWYSQGKGC